MTEAVPVSVVMPCYRCAQTVERAVASVAAQTVRPMELILVDDGNADETRSVLAALRDRYSPGWIKLVLLEQNVGAASARNAGWEAASGQFIAFLDADDSWHPRKIELQYRFMLAQPDIVMSGHGHAQVEVHGSEMPERWCDWEECGTSRDNRSGRVRADYEIISGSSTRSLMAPLTMLT